MTKTRTAKPTADHQPTVELHQVYGIPTPRIVLPEGAGRGLVGGMTGHRQLRAQMLRLAAEIELATPAGEGWAVVLGDDDRYSVRLEMSRADKRECDAGMAVLRSVLKRTSR